MTEDNEGAPTRKRIAVAVSSTETPLRADPSASFTYSVDTARRFHSGPPMAYDPSDLSPHTVPDMTGYRNYYPRPSADQQSSYYGVPGPATTWGSSMPSTYSDETGSGVGVDYSGMQAQYNSPMMPLYASPSPSRWAGSRASGSQVYATDTTYSPVYQTATSSSSSDASGMTAMAPFPGMGRMAASLPTPPALVDGTKMGAMLPTPASSSRNPLPSSPSTYRMPSSVHMSEGLPPSSSPVESGNSATYYEYPPQASNLGSAGTPVSATRSTLPGNGSTLSITSSTASATDPGLYSSGQGSTRDDAYGPSHQGLQIFRHDQDLKSQGSNENMSYMYSGGGGGDTGSGYYSPASVEVPGTAGSSAERDSSRVGLRA
ncbi:hypothetical protein MKZ38_001534 [Zalerion maritima]|uniref:Uncharacterized protein n=1 Tax=Zalerion maritima TaxID=339359 RepID=A0AAD5RRR5_9PEZI|nr:hypothetical protein MKZ38_001534 [Zalerion maritima]